MIYLDCVSSTQAIIRTNKGVGQLKIKEVENKTGMSRENIRFYEKQKLINPTRLKNGYREFRDEDVQSLLVIKLLRSIHVPLKEIKELIDHESTLTKVLREQREWLEREKEDKDLSLRVCEAMWNEETNVANLDATKYLNMFEEMAVKSGKEYVHVNHDKSTQIVDINKRLWARIYDFVIYAIFLSAIAILLLHINISNSSLLELILYFLVLLIFMLFIEPLLLSTIGTTIGKFIYGLGILSDSGEKLTYKEALKRTFEVLKFGIGLLIPYFNLRHYYKEYKHLIEEEKVPWDGLGTYKRDEKIIVQSIGSFLVLLILFLGAPFLQRAQNIPPHRGELTIEEFVENYHHYEDLLGLENERYQLNNKGEFMDVQSNRIFTAGLRYEEKPLFWYELKDNKIKSISFDISIQNKKLPLVNYVNERYLIFLSLVGAQKEAKIHSFPLHEIGNSVSSRAFENNDLEMYGVTANYKVEYEGYKEMFAVLYPKDQSQTHRLNSSFVVTIP